MSDKNEPAHVPASWRLYFTPRQIIIALLGFSSGLPLALTASTLTAWLAEAGVERAAIGLFAAVATPYALKFLWAPVIDGLAVPFLSHMLGHRRGWMLAAQIALALAIAAMAFANPAAGALATSLAALLVATLSATQDIAIDAFRVESLPKEEQGMGAAMATFGYRIGMLVSGAGALWLADRAGWQTTYFIMAALMGVGAMATLWAREVTNGEGQVQGAMITRETTSSLRGQDEAGPETVNSPSVGALATGGGEAIGDILTPTRSACGLAPLPPQGGGDNGQRATRHFLRDHVIAPFADFMTRPHWLAVLWFVVLYKLGDAFMGIMFNPFLLDLGFTKSQIAEIVKIYGLAATLTGTFLGGSLVARYGTYPILMLAGILHMLTNLLLVVQAGLGPDAHFLTFAIVTENVTGGMSLAAFTAYLSLLCRLNYTATQYALLSSLAALGRTLFSSASGGVVVWLSAWTWLQEWESPLSVLVSTVGIPRFTADTMGWAGFFFFCSLLAIPGLVLLYWLEGRKADGVSG